MFGWYVFRVQSYLLIRCLEAQGLVKTNTKTKKLDMIFTSCICFQAFFVAFEKPWDPSPFSTHHAWTPMSFVSTMWREVPGPNGGILPRIDLQTFQVSGAFGVKKTTTKKKHPLACNMIKPSIEKWRNMINPYLILTYDS